MSHGVPCDCVTNHVPVVVHTEQHHIHPLGMGGPDTPDNIISVCPSTHDATHRLLRLTGYRYDGNPPWWVVREFPYAARRLAADGWARWDTAGRPVAWERWIHQLAHP